jgi:chromosome condensin MukBEF complex kleisin-like MukF subunit
VPADALASGARRQKIERQLWLAAAQNRSAELLLVGREDLDAFPAARNCDVPLLRVRGGANCRVGEQDVIDSLPLRAI